MIGLVETEERADGMTKTRFDSNGYQREGTRTESCRDTSMYRLCTARSKGRCLRKSGSGRGRDSLRRPSATPSLAEVFDIPAQACARRRGSGPLAPVRHTRRRTLPAVADGVIRLRGVQAGGRRRRAGDCQQRPPVARPALAIPSPWLSSSGGEAVKVEVRELGRRVAIARGACGPRAKAAVFTPEARVRLAPVRARRGVSGFQRLAQQVPKVIPPCALSLFAQSLGICANAYGEGLAPAIQTQTARHWTQRSIFREPVQYIQEGSRLSARCGLFHNLGSAVSILRFNRNKT